MIHHKITPEAITRIVVKLRAVPAFTTGFSPEAHMQALIGLREAERIYHQRCRAGRLTWQSAAALRKVRTLLGDIPEWAFADVVDFAALRARINDIIAAAPEKPKQKLRAAKKPTPAAPKELLIGQDLPLAYRALTGVHPKKARKAGTSKVYETGFVVFARAALVEMGLPDLDPSTIARYLEWGGVRDNLVRQK